MPFVANSPLMSFFYHQPAGRIRQHMNTGRRARCRPTATGRGRTAPTVRLWAWLGDRRLWRDDCTEPLVAARRGGGQLSGLWDVAGHVVVSRHDAGVLGAGGCGSSEHGFPLLRWRRRLVVKDAIMMGAALVTMADSAKSALRPECRRFPAVRSGSVDCRREKFEPRTRLTNGASYYESVRAESSRSLERIPVRQRNPSFWSASVNWKRTVDLGRI